MINNREGYLKKGTVLFDKYTVVSEKPVGEGSNWLVYICNDSEGHLLCIKEYYPVNEQLVRDENGFLRNDKDGDSYLEIKEPAINHELEMQNAARIEFIENDNVDELKHTNWESVYSATKLKDSRFGDTFYIVMDVLSGQALSDAITTGFQDKIYALNVAIELGNVIGMLHKKGILHLDIKPQNFFLTTSGRVIVLDFGSAIYRGKDYTEEEINNTGIGQYTEGFCSSDLIAISQEDNIEKKRVLLAKLDERPDVYAYLRIIKQMFNDYPDESGLINSLQEMYDKKKYELKEYVSVLMDHVIAEYHTIESIDSLLNNSRKLLQYKKQEEKVVRYYPELCRNKKTEDSIISISDIVQSRKDVIIQGGEGTGKTMLILQCWQELLDNRHLAIYVDLRKTDKDGHEAWTYLIDTIKREYHIDIDGSIDGKMAILCDNILSLDTSILFHEYTQDKDIKLIMAVSDCGREISSNYHEVDCYTIGELTIGQKKWFFENNRDLFSQELTKFEAGDQFNRICTVDDLVSARRIKRSKPEICINDISLVEEKHKLFINSERIPEKKLSLIYGFEHFLPWLAMQLYFDDEYLFWESRKSIDTIRKDVSEYDFLPQAVSYYLSLGVLAQGKKEFTYIPVEYDYERNLYITKYVAGHKIHFHREEDFCFFVAKYVLSDYKKQQHKENSILCRFQLDYSVIKQLSFIVDINSLLEWYSADGMSSYRYASRNIIAAIAEKGEKDCRIDVGSHTCYDEKWPEMDEIDPYINWSSFYNKKRMQVVKRKENISVFFGNQSSEINVATWKGTVVKKNNQSYRIGNHLLGIEEAGLKRIYFLKNFEITDKMELPILVRINNSANNNTSEKSVLTESILDTSMFVSGVGDSYKEVIDVYDLFNKTYILVRGENPMRIKRTDHFLVKELIFNDEDSKLLTKDLFAFDSRYFKHDEFPITIKGCNRIIALGMVSKQCLDDYLHKTYFDLSSDIYKMSFVVQFYINVNGEWHRYPIQLKRENIRCFDVMDLDNEKSLIVYLSYGKLKYLLYNKDISRSFEPLFQSESEIVSFTLLKDSRTIAFIDSRGYLRLMNLEKEIGLEMDLGDYNLKKESIRAIDNDYLWFNDENDIRRCYIVSLLDKKVKVFDIPFD